MECINAAVSASGRGTGGSQRSYSIPQHIINKALAELQTPPTIIRKMTLKKKTLIFIDSRGVTQHCNINMHINEPIFMAVIIF